MNCVLYPRLYTTVVFPICLLFYLFFHTNISYSQTLTVTFTPGSNQQWTVPACVSAISMNVRGADGGNSEDELGGEGQTVVATFPVQPGEVLEIVAGIAGSGTGIIGSGGGGGSGVINRTTNTLLVVAGGGGGSAGEFAGGTGKGGSTVLTTLATTCSGFDTNGCGGSLFDRNISNTGGGGGGGFLGMGDETLALDGSGISGLGGLGGFGVLGGLGGYSASDTNGGFGIGGGGGGGGECAGGGGGGGYIGGKGGSVHAGPDGGGSGGSGFVNGVAYTATSGGTGTSTQRNGAVTFSYIVNSPPTVSANATTNNDTISLSATFIASSTSIGTSSWLWTGPNGYSATVEDPPAFAATANTDGTYTVLVTDNNGCTNTATASLISSNSREESKIPTMSEWGLIIYGLLVLNLSVWFIMGIDKVQV